MSRLTGLFMPNRLTELTIQACHPHHSFTPEPSNKASMNGVDVKNNHTIQGTEHKRHKRHSNWSFFCSSCASCVLFLCFLCSVPDLLCSATPEPPAPEQNKACM